VEVNAVKADYCTIKAPRVT